MLALYCGQLVVYKTRRGVGTSGEDTEDGGGGEDIEGGGYGGGGEDIGGGGYGGGGEDTGGGGGEKDTGGGGYGGGGEDVNKALQLLRSHHVLSAVLLKVPEYVFLKVTHSCDTNDGKGTCARVSQLLGKLCSAVSCRFVQSVVCDYIIRHKPV